MENIEKVLGSDITSENSQSVGAVEDLKLNEQRGNVIENKGSGLENQVQSGNIIENKRTYAQNAGMLLKTKGVSVW
jgi:sporulation protein YlmC with PRC-barrel domain